MDIRCVKCKKWIKNERHIEPPFLCNLCLNDEINQFGKKYGSNVENSLILFNRFIKSKYN